jgi:trehalose 6-phosphate phosphatase
VRIENKGITGSIHYRLAPDQRAARARILELVGRRALTSGLRVEEGRMVVNLLPPLRVSKGSAVRWLAESYRLDGLVYFGDDLTDVHAFETLRTLRSSGQAQTLGIGVVGPETPARVRQVVDACVPSAEAVAELLGGLLEWLHPSDTMEAGVPSTVRSSE